MGKRKHPPLNERKAKEIGNMLGMGIPLKDVCNVMMFSEDWLAEELAIKPALAKIIQQAKSQPVADVSKSLYSNAMSGNLGAQIFWLKCRAGWKEPPREVSFSFCQEVFGKETPEQLTKEELRKALPVAFEKLGYKLEDLREESFEGEIVE